MNSNEAFLIVGLGNPGEKYAWTRHNFGYLLVEALGRNEGWKLQHDKYVNGYKAKGEYKGKQIYLLLPTTYMNESGVAVKKAIKDFQISIPNTLVVVDDTALDFGEMRVRPHGSAGGHNGLKSIEAQLNTIYYPRLRLGIGKSTGSYALADYVLDRFSKEELENIPQILQKGVDVIHRIITHGISKVMNEINSRKTDKPNLESQENKNV